MDRMVQSILSMSPIFLAAVAAGIFSLSSKKPRSKKNAVAKKNGTKNNGAPLDPGSLPPQCEGAGVGGGYIEGVDYIEFVTGGAGQNDQLPMVISLHGLGYDYNAHVKWLEELEVPVRVILPNGFFEKSSSKKRAWWSSYSDRALKDASEGLANFVYYIQQCRPTLGKPVMTGHSMGGFVALDFATQFPELISASVPVAATRSKRLWDIEPGVPVHGIHGELDGTFDQANSYYYAMYERGLPVNITSVAGAPHRLTSKTAEAWRQALLHIIG